MSKHVAESINLTTDCRKFWPRRPSSSVYKAGKTKGWLTRVLCVPGTVSDYWSCKCSLASPVAESKPAFPFECPILCMCSCQLVCICSVWVQYFHGSVCVYIRILSFQPCTWQLWSHVTGWLSNHLTEHVFDSFLSVCSHSSFEISCPGEHRIWNAVTSSGHILHGTSCRG